MTINDAFTKNGKVRADGKMIHDTYLVQVKSPSESKTPWDYYRIVKTVPGDQSFAPLSESKCPLVKK
jgi:branched-chain amino acid transport system substrate-binding protein